MHCASLGEFEQGRPLLEAIKKANPATLICVSFFSPSGYEVQKNYVGADNVYYLPIDSKKNAATFLDIVEPDIVLWVKYEYWHYYLQAVKERAIPLLMVSGLFRQQQSFFAWYGTFWRNMLPSFTHFFVQNQESVNLLHSISAQLPVSISGDTRFDRVIEIAQQVKHLLPIQQFCGDSKVIVAGSTWDDDEAELVHFVKANAAIKFIIAPHEIGQANLKEVKATFAGAIFYSEWLLMDEASKKAHVGNVLIIDNIGMLSSLYYYADITYVGGGFNAGGIHNVLEAGVYGKPVIIGPVYSKFAEAVDLVDAGAVFSIENAVELESVLNKLLQDETALKKAGAIAKDYAYSKAGATQTILQYVYEKRLLTS
jgi:3-deoxy-D-manno-octulosonic-acid transferase